MEVTQAAREFKYNGMALADPGTGYTVVQVREFYANLYPEIVNADIEGPENVGAKVVYTFRRAVGTKGADREELRTRLSAAMRGENLVDAAPPGSFAFDLEAHQGAMSSVARAANVALAEQASGAMTAPSDLLELLP